MEGLIHFHVIPYTVTSDEGGLCVEMKCGTGTILIKFTRLTLPPPFLKPLIWQNGGLSFWKIMYGTSQVAYGIACAAEAVSSRAQYML